MADHDGAEMAGPRETAQAEMGRWLDVARKTLLGQAAVVRSSLQVARSAATGELGAGEATRAYAQAARRGVERYWRTSSRLGAEYVQGLSAMAQQAAVELLDDVAAARRPRSRGATRSATSTDADAHQAAAASSAASTARTLALRGSLGDRARGSITVVNRHARARRVELDAGTVVDEAGADVVGAVLELVPNRTTLPAGAEAVVDVGIELVPGVFEIGHQYLVSVQISGAEEATVVCGIDVTP